MAAEPGAPFMGFVCVLDGVVQLHGKYTDMFLKCTLF